MEVRTHHAIDHALCGEPRSIGEGVAEVALSTTREMAADAHGLVHGGFVFGAIDHAAMLAVNDPNVVLGSASVRFTAPVRVGEVVLCRAEVSEAKGKKRVVRVAGAVGDVEVLVGELVAFVVERNILE